MLAGGMRPGIAHGGVPPLLLAVSCRRREIIDLLAAVAASPSNLKVHAWPCLEWVSELGDPTDAEYDSIWASPSDEVAWLASLVQRN